MTFDRQDGTPRDMDCGTIHPTILLAMYTYLLYKFLYTLYDMLVEFNSFNGASCDRCHLCFGNWRFDLIQRGKLQNKFNNLKYTSFNIITKT